MDIADRSESRDVIERRCPTASAEIWNKDHCQKIKRNHSISAHSINPVANKKPFLKKDGFVSKVCDAGPNVYLFLFSCLIF